MLIKDSYEPNDDITLWRYLLVAKDDTVTVNVFSSLQLVNNVPFLFILSAICIKMELGPLGYPPWTKIYYHISHHIIRTLRLWASTLRSCNLFLN